MIGGVHRRGWLSGWLPSFGAAGQMAIGERPEWTEAHRLWVEHAPVGRAAAVYVNGLRQAAGVDYQISGREIIMLREWDQTTDIVLVDYEW